MPTPTPRDIPTELRTAYREGNLIVVVGPELSSAAGLPGTEQLTEQLLELAVERGLHLDQARLSRWIDEGRSADALGLLERRFGADFQRQIERRLSDQGAVIPSLAKIIACLGERLRAVYTTSLDRLLERAFLDQWPSFAIPRADLAQRRALIFKLRGTLEFAQSWVLTAEQRAREFSSRSLRQAVFEAAYNAHQLVFVGFTPGSELLVCLLDMVEAAAGAGQGPSHFFVAADCGLEERKQLERRGLEVIRGPTEAVLRELGGLAGGEGEVRTMTAEALEITGSPYPGLQAFTEERAQLFFGRQAEISQAASRLGGLGSDHRRWLAIEGSSGIGKSSFAQAGIVPALRRGFGANTPARWRVATIRPGVRPMSNLVRALHEALELGGELELEDSLELHEFADSLDGEAFSRLLSQRGAGWGVLVVVDQLEELVTLSEPEERERFSRALAEALERGVLYLVTTLRSDFVPSFQQVAPALAGLLNEKAERYALSSISRVGLREAIVTPAQLCEVEIEAQLVEQIVLDAEALGGARGEGRERTLTRASTLPLVAHVLRGLWDAGAHDNGIVELHEYEALGGVGGALSRSADALLGELVADEQRRAKALLLAMVRVDASGAGETRRTLTRDEAGAIAGEPVLMKLSGGGEGQGARLLVVHVEGEQAWVDLVHEALLREWTTLAGWIDEDRGQLVLDSELERQAARWQERGRPRWGLARGSELAGLLQGRPRGAEQEMQRVYQAVLQRAAFVRRTVWSTVAVVVVAVSLGVTLLVSGKNDELADTNDELEGKNIELTQQEQDLKDKDKRVTSELNTQKGLRASMLAKVPGNELEALALAVGACGSDGSLAAEVPASVFSGLASALVGVEAGLPLQGHEDKVVGVAYSPDGARIATAGFDKSIRLWDANSGALLQTIADHDDKVHAVVFSSDGTRLASASADKTARVWDASTGKELAKLTHEDAVIDVAFSPDGARVATAGQDGVARVWDVAKKEELTSVAHDGPVRAVVFSPDGAQLASASEDGTVRVWEASTGAPVRTLGGHEGTVYALSFSADGTRLASAGEDRTARLWDAATGEPLGAFEHGEIVRTVAFSVDGRHLATGTFDDDAAHLWDVDAARRITSFHHGGPVVDVVFSPSGEQLATVSWDGTGRSWNVDGGGALMALEGHADRVYAVAVSPDGERMATGSGDNDARLWSAKTGAPLAILRGHALDLGAVAFSPDGKQLATASWDGSVRLWDGVSGAALRELEGHEGRVHAVTFSPDGKQLATASADKSVRVWNAETGEALTTLDHDAAVLGVTFSPDGAQLLAVTAASMARLWDTSTWDASDSFGFEGPVTAAAFSPDGAHIALATKGHSVALWDPESNVTLKTVAGQETFDGHTAPVVDVVFSADGAKLATASEDGTARMWDVATRVELVSFPHAGPVVDVAFSVDGTRLVTASGDEVARVWELEAGAWLEWGCAVLDGREAHSPDTPEACPSTPTGHPRTLDAGEPTVVAAYGPRPKVITVHGVELVLIPGGTFMMGSPEGEGESHEHPQHEVELDSFYMAVSEVTNAQYALYLEANPDAPKPGDWDYERYNQPQQPVIGVSWHDAKAYCDWAGLVLPTEAQWEYAARAGTTTTYWFGDDGGDLDRFGWYLDNSGARNHSVGVKDANAFGLVDVAGNVWEWTFDAYGDYTTSPRVGDGLRHKPVGVAYRVVRGGSRFSHAGIARSGFRYKYDPGNRYDNVGFRVAQGIP